MSKPINNKIIAGAALLLLALAVALSVWLLADDGEATEENTTNPVQTTAVPETTTKFDGLVPVVSTKFLWQYGTQHIALAQPMEISTEPESVSDDQEDVYVPETYFEVVTNWKGEAVTGDDGKEVTEIRTKPQTTVYTEVITGADGEAITDEDGNAVTEIHSEEVTTLPPPVFVTNESGEYVTGEDGEIITEIVTVPPERTTAAVGGNSDGAAVWAQGITDGDNYVRMKIYIDGEYDITRSSVMTMTLREKSGLIAIPDTLTYNLYKGTCSLSPTKKYEQMAYVTKTGGQTVVTLIIPEEARPAAANTTSFSARSTISTFRDSAGETIDEFTVSVNLS